MRTRPRGSRMKTFLAVIFSVMLTLTMMPVMPFMTGDVHADTSYTFYVRNGNVTVADDTTNTGKVKVTCTNTVSLGNIDPATETITLTGTTKSNTVSVTTTHDVTIILNGLNIDVSGTNDACAFSKTGTGALTLSLAGTNVLRSGANRAGLEKNGASTESGSLTIQDLKSDASVGSLEATSGKSSNNGQAYYGQGAGIGGRYNSSGDGYSSEKITISSGNVTAKSHNGAGIGGGTGNDTGGVGSNITISGGTVSAISSGYGAGIGGGQGGSTGGAGGIVTISGGNVTAESGIGAGIGGNGAGIGGGAAGVEGSSPGGAGGTVTISNGSVTAKSHNGAGIGGGQGGSQGGSNGAGGILSSGTNGNAWVVRSGRADANEAAINTSNSEFKSGVLFNGSQGTVYGNTSLPGDEEIPKGSTLTIPSNTRLTIPYKTTLINNGVIDSPGCFHLQGTINNKGEIDLSVFWALESPEAFTSTGKVTFDFINFLENVTFDPNGGELDCITIMRSFAYKTLIAPIKSGDTCVGWRDSNGNTYGPTETLNSIHDTTLTAMWASEIPSPSTYSITLKGDGGTGSALMSYTEGTGATLPTDWTKEGYSFAGWYDNSDFTGNAVTAISSTDTGGKTFYAKWTLDKPAAPKSVKAKAAGKHSVKLTWSKAKGADQYKVYMAKSKAKSAKSAAKAGKYKYIGKTSGTSFAAKGLKAGTKYYFIVKAVNGAGIAKSAAVSARTAKEPVSFTLSNISGNNVKVHWSKVSGAAKYQVASNSSGKMKTKWTGTNSLCTYTSTNLTKGKTYKYKMRYCKVKSGKNVWSKWSAVKTIKVK